MPSLNSIRIFQHKDITHILPSLFPRQMCLTSAKIPPYNGMFLYRYPRSLANTTRNHFTLVIATRHPSTDTNRHWNNTVNIIKESLHLVSKHLSNFNSYIGKSMIFRTIHHSCLSGLGSEIEIGCHLLYRNLSPIHPCQGIIVRMFPEHCPRHINITPQAQRTLVKFKTIATNGAHPREEEIK